MSYPRNAASPERIAIGAVVQISDGAVQTSGVAVKVVPFGGSEASGTGSVDYSADGVVIYTPVQAETDYTSFVLIASKSGCIPASTTVVTSAESTAGLVRAASVTGSVGSVVGSVGSVVGNVGGNLNGNVSGNVSGSVGSVTGAVGSVTGSVGSVVGSVGGSVASVAGAVGSVTGNVGGDVSGKVLGNGSGTISGDGVRAASVTGAVGSVTGSVGSVVGTVTAELDPAVADQITAIETFATRVTTGIVQDGTVWQFTANMLELGPSGSGGGSATLEKQEEILAAIQGTEVIQVASPNVSGNLVLTQGDDYDGTANPRAQWTVTTDYTSGWTVALTIRDADDEVIYTTSGTVVSATVIAVTIAAPTGLTMTGCPGQWQGKFDVQLTHTATGKKKTIALGVCYINEDQTR